MDSSLFLGLEDAPPWRHPAADQRRGVHATPPAVEGWGGAPPRATVAREVQGGCVPQQRRRGSWPQLGVGKTNYFFLQFFYFFSFFAKCIPVDGWKSFTTQRCIFFWGGGRSSVIVVAHLAIRRGLVLMPRPSPARREVFRQHGGDQGRQLARFPTLGLAHRVWWCAFDFLIFASLKLGN